MFKLLKWDLINFIKKYCLLLLGILAANILFELFVIGSFSLGFSFEYLYPPIYNRIWTHLLIFAVALLSMSSWLHKSSAPLIASIYSRPWKIIVSKLIVAVITSTSIFFLSEIIIQIACLITNQPNKIIHYGSIPMVNFSSILLYSTVAIFSFVFAKSFYLTRKSPIISAGIIYFAVRRIFAVLDWMIVYSAQIMPEIAIIIPFTALLFVSGCILYKYRFQIN